MPKTNGHPCVVCKHPRASHERPVDNGCQEPDCHCLMYCVDGIAWAIQAGSKWIQFNDKEYDGGIGTSWTCSRLGDARIFPDDRIAEDYIRRYRTDKHPPWVVRELLVTPLEETS